MEADITISSGYDTEKYEMKRAELENGEVIHTLTILNITHQDLGTYLCKYKEDPESVLQEALIFNEEEGE